MTNIDLFEKDLSQHGYDAICLQHCDIRCDVSCQRYL